MNSHGPWIRGLILTGVIAIVPCTTARAQSPDPSSQTTSANPEDGRDYGNYHVKQSIEIGYRYTDVSGNYQNYDTFVNLGTGVRLLDSTLDMHSINHDGTFFDDLTMASFGYGGDPDNVTRLHVDKNKWYDFSGIYRRDKNYWNYNLLANPLNPSNSNPAIGINYALHGGDLSHRMSDYDVTLMPQSRVSFRLGYSYNVEEGPSLSTYHSGTDTQLAQSWKTTNNGYRFGFDFKLSPKTSFSYDQFLQYYKQDTSWMDENQTYQLLSGVPVDLGIDWYTNAGEPCGAPITNPTTVPPTAYAGCNAYVSYSRVGRPRVTIPTEQFRFHTTYIQNLDMTGRFAYTSEDNSVSDFAENLYGNETRTLQQVSNVVGPSNGRNITVHTDWGATYNITRKFRVMDSLRYDSFNNPGMWAMNELSQFAQAPLLPGSASSLLLPPAVFNLTNCPPPYTADTCPQHNSSSGPDTADGIYMTFLGQQTIQNTIQLGYDFTRKFGARLGYHYSAMNILDYNALFWDYETFFPGSGQDAAYRGDCALVNGALPPGCVMNSDGSVTFSGLSSDSDTTRNSTKIHQRTGLFGFWAHPAANLRINVDMELMSADKAYTRISPRQMQHVQAHVLYNPLPWVTFDTSFDIHQNRDNVETVNDIEHDRNYTFNTMLLPNNRFSFDLGYTYNNIYSQAIVCWTAGFGPPPPGVGPCPADGSPVPLGSLSFYNSTTNFAYGDIIWKPIKRVMAKVGYAGNFVNGNTLFLNPNTPYGPLAFNYQKPYAGFDVDLGRGVTYKTAWNYFGYNLKSPPNAATLAPIGGQDFNGNGVTFSMKYAF